MDRRIEILPVALALALLAGSASAQATSAGTRTRLTPSLERDQRFAVIGDYGVDSVDEGRVASLVAGWGPDFVVTTGDNNYPEGAAATIDANIGKYWHGFIAPYTGAYGAGASTNRFFPTLGNHDWIQAGAAAYLNYFALPGNERTYTFVRGAVRFWALDSDPAEPDGITHASAQALWLKAGLAAATEPFQVVVFHHPPHSSGTHGDDGNLAWPFREWGADVVLNGHDHTYERFSIGGFPYLVVGLGGAPIYALGTPHAGSVARYNADHGALIGDVLGDRLQLSFVSAEGFVADQVVLAPEAALDTQLLVPAGSVWRIRDDGVDLGTAWSASAYVDAGWTSGPAQLGYGDGDEATTVSYGPDPQLKWPTTYFRHSFAVADPAAFERLVLETTFDDGVAVYLNGVQVARQNLPAGTIAWGQLASASISGADENRWTAFEVPAAALLAGTNVLAVEVHQVLRSSSDITFDLRLTGRLRGTTLISRGSTWRYRDAGLLPGAGWRSNAYDDSAWAQGPAQLGYGDGGEATVLSYGPNPAAKPLTTWFRRTFQVANAASVRGLGLRLLADDGAAIYVNGVEVFRRNLPVEGLGPASATELALDLADEDTYWETLLDSRCLRNGTNTIAIELHQASPTDPDASFDLELIAY
ncbi:MAG: metallophosphoesterase [Planctomycetota bacterium]|nr:metallophosphoesterase [Planctomycetota bacterium]